MIIPRWILLRMRNVPDKSCRANKYTFYAQIFFSENSAVYDILCKKYGATRQAMHGNMMLRRKHVLCMRFNYSETRDAHLWYFILIASYLINSFWFRKMFCGNSYKTEKFQTTYLSLRSAVPNCVFEEDQKRTNEQCSLCHFARRTAYVLFL